MIGTTNKMRRPKSQTWADLLHKLMIISKKSWRTHQCGSQRQLKQTEQCCKHAGKIPAAVSHTSASCRAIEKAFQCKDGWANHKTDWHLFINFSKEDFYDVSGAEFHWLFGWICFWWQRELSYWGMNLSSDWLKNNLLSSLLITWR